MTTRNTILIALAAAIILPTSASAQNDDDPIRLGLFGGANYNMVGVGEGAGMAAQLPVTDDVVDGTGIDPFAGLVFEYNPGTLLGVQARIAYDDRTATFGHAAGEVKGTVSYITFEPGVLLNIGSPCFHVVAGPSVGYLVRNAFDYAPTELTDTSVAYDGMRDVAFGAWMNVAYDIWLYSSSEGSQLFLTPFVGGSWIVDQAEAPESAQAIADDRDWWNTATVRGGLQFSYGF